jgi:hypothetical protein
VEFQRVLAESGIRAKFDMEPDFNLRLAALKDGLHSSPRSRSIVILRMVRQMAGQARRFS